MSENQLKKETCAAIDMTSMFTMLMCFVSEVRISFSSDKFGDLFSLIRLIVNILPMWILAAWLKRKINKLVSEAQISYRRHET